MLIGGVVIGLVLGLLLRGRPGNLLDARIRWSGLLFLAVIVRFGTELAISNGVAIADTLRLPLFAGAFGLLLVTLWHNRAVPGMLVVMAGVASNAFAVVVNGGWMPVWPPSLAVVGFTYDDLVPTFHTLLPIVLDEQFLRMASVSKRAINRHFARLGFEHREDFRDHDCPVRSGGSFAGREHLCDCVGITLRPVFLVFLFESARVFAAVARTPSLRRCRRTGR